MAERKLKKTATFNGKHYIRNISMYSKKEIAEKDANYMREKMNKCVILDKNKEGYFFWIRSKPKSKKR